MGFQEFQGRIAITAPALPLSHAPMHAHALSYTRAHLWERVAAYLKFAGARVYVKACACMGAWESGSVGAVSRFGPQTNFQSTIGMYPALPENL